MSASKEDNQILQARIDLLEAQRISDEKLKTSSERKLRISEEKVNALHNTIQQLNKHIENLECELEINLLTSMEMPIELI